MFSERNLDGEALRRRHRRRSRAARGVKQPAPFRIISKSPIEIILCVMKPFDFVLDAYSWVAGIEGPCAFPLGKVIPHQADGKKSRQ